MNLRDLYERSRLKISRLLPASSCLLDEEKVLSILKEGVEEVDERV